MRHLRRTDRYPRRTLGSNHRGNRFVPVEEPRRGTRRCLHSVRGGVRSSLPAACVAAGLALHSLLRLLSSRGQSQAFARAVSRGWSSPTRRYHSSSRAAGAASLLSALRSPHDLLTQDPLSLQPAGSTSTDCFVHPTRQSMNAALSNFCRSATGTVLSWPGDPLGHQQFSEALPSRISPPKLSFLLSGGQPGLRLLTYRFKIQVSLRRPTSVPQTQAP